MKTFFNQTPPNAVPYDNKTVNKHHMDDYGNFDGFFDSRLNPASRYISGTISNAGVKPEDIWGEFYQGQEGNCVTVSAIKATMMKFGHNPHGIYQKIEKTSDGFKVTMKDNFTLDISHDELQQGIKNSSFRGYGPVLSNANFLYAVSAKRAQLENNDGWARSSFADGMRSLNDGEYVGEALTRLGLASHVSSATVQELIDGAIGTLANALHSVAVVDGYIDLWGTKEKLADSPWRSASAALKLT